VATLFFVPTVFSAIRARRRRAPADSRASHATPGIKQESLLALARNTGPI
jgi:hypothetical protein